MNAWELLRRKEHPSSTGSPHPKGFLRTAEKTINNTHTHTHMRTQTRHNSKRTRRVCQARIPAKEQRRPVKAQFS